jgi:hypothetical protein
MFAPVCAGRQKSRLFTHGVEYIVRFSGAALGRKARLATYTPMAAIGSQDGREVVMMLDSRRRARNGRYLLKKGLSQAK